MFTVIIAEKDILDLFDEFGLFLRPLMQKDAYGLCRWEKEGESIEEMLPDLYTLIENQEEWRAIVVNRDGLQQINPFDFTNHTDVDARADGELSFEGLAARRARRLETYDKAVLNPLMRLTSALCGMPVYDAVVEDEDTYARILSGELPLGTYMLKRQLAALDLSATVASLRRYGKEKLNVFVPESDMELLLQRVKEQDVPGLLTMISPDRLPDFIGLLGDYDPLYADPEYVDCIVENTYKTALYKELAEAFTLQDILPSEVICVAPRTVDHRRHARTVAWEGRDEREYSSFAAYNMYPEGLRYLTFDIRSERNRQYDFDRIRFISFLLLLASNDVPQGAVSPKKLYRVEVDFCTDAVKRVCGAYLSKLYSTQVHIRELQATLEANKPVEVDNKTAQRLFESEIDVPVEINPEFEKGELYAKYRSIGLANDCPTDEKDSWSAQYREISKRFVRYLREPRRSVKYAVEHGVEENAAIDDERIETLTARQREDVGFHLLDEEEKMVDTVTPPLFHAREYNERIEKADAELRENMTHRMTKKKILVTSVIGLVAYLFGFLPLLLDNVDTPMGIPAAWAVTGVAMGLLTLIAAVFLLVMRRRLINRFVHFNKVMGGILSEIDNGLEAFSHYLSHACNVMRGFSVLNYAEKSRITRDSIIRKHSYDIERQIADIHEMLYGYVDLSEVHVSETDPYDYDFTQLRDYTYDMPCEVRNTRVEFIQTGYTVTVPIDYVQRVTLTREELYD